jgi:hypothetical protein
MNSDHVSVFAGKLSFVLALSLAAACGGSQPPPAQPAPPAPAASEAPAAASPAAAPSAAPSAAPAAEAAPAAPPAPPGPGEWDKWSRDQKLAYMKTAVMPKMGALFHDFDAKTYAEPRCNLCHGSGAKEGNFKMPNPELPKLSFDPAAMKKLHAEKGPMLEFMGKQVVPTMAQLLGEQPFDPKTHKGFGCMECHTGESAGAKAPKK